MAKKFAAKKIKTLVIDRSKWQRISSEVETFNKKENLAIIEELLPSVYSSFLYDTNNKRMCCLGFYCEKAGFSKSEMNGQTTPVALIGKENELPALVEIHEFSDGDNEARDNKITEKLIDINDNEKLSDAEKQQRIIREFAKINVKVKFTGPTIKEEIETIRQKYLYNPDKPKKK